MTLDLGDGKSITVNAFQGKVWTAIRSNGGGLTVAFDRQQTMELACELVAAARKLRREG